MGCQLNPCLFQTRVLCWIFPNSEGEGVRVKNPNWLSSISVCVCLRSHWYFLLNFELQFILENPTEQRMAYYWVRCKNYIAFQISISLIMWHKNKNRIKIYVTEGMLLFPVMNFWYHVSKWHLLSTRYFPLTWCQREGNPQTSPQWGIPQCLW